MTILRIILLQAVTFAIGLMWSFSKPAPVPITPIYPEELPGAFTGGFGEETCHSCHFDYPINPEQGSMVVNGIPKVYQPGKSYKVSVIVKRDELGQAGFQLTSRYRKGSQAGSFKIHTDSLSFTEVEAKVQYLQHTQKSSWPDTASTARWHFTWIAPDSGSIIFNIAANAGNGDASAFGDYIYARTFKAAPVKN